MANEQNPYLPFAQEFNLIDQFRGGKQITAPTVSGAGVPLMSGEQLQQLMTSYLRGQGNFLERSRAQNMAGLYNTSTNRLIQDNALAEASRQATEANVKIQQGNQQLAQNAQTANKELQLRAMEYNARQPRKRSAGDVALAALMQGLQAKYSEKDSKGNKKKQAGFNESPIVQGAKDAWGSVTDFFSGGPMQQTFDGIPSQGADFAAVEGFSPMGGFIEDANYEVIGGMSTPYGQVQGGNAGFDSFFNPAPQEYASLTSPVFYQDPIADQLVSNYSNLYGASSDWTSGADAGGTYERSTDEDFVWE